MIEKLAAAALAALVATPASARCWRPGETVSWYGEPQRVRSGARFDPSAATCAHPSLPDGSVLLIRNLDNGKAAFCTVNDHGPAAWTRCKVDVSRRLAVELGMIGRGVARASVAVLRRGPG